VKPTRHNLLVTCGASAIIRAKGELDLDKKRPFLAALGLDGTPEFLEFLVPILASPGDTDFRTIHDPAAFLKDSHVQAMAALVEAGLLRHWGEHETALGRPENLFSAEIGTLTAMTRGDNPGWRPQTDRGVLLASETRLGLFAAMVVRNVILKGWLAPAENVEVLCVPRLKEKPENADQALANLADLVAQNLRESTADDPWRNILVMSGGFKSAAPCLTIFSLLYGIELVYIFERCNELQSLHPRLDLNTKKLRNFWKKTWTDMYKNGIAEGASSYFRIAMQDRMDRPESVF